MRKRLLKSTKIAQQCVIFLRLLNWITDKRTFLILAIILRFVQGLGAACYITAAYSVVASLFRQSIATTMVFKLLCIAM